MTSRIRAKCGNEVRIRKKTHIEDQISIVGNPGFIAEAHARYQDIAVSLAWTEFVSHVGAQLVHVEFRAVDDDVRQGADGLEMPALFGQRCANCAFFAQRMWAARLAEAAQQSVVRCFQKKD